MRCPKSRFPIRIIVFDELKLIIFVSQGLTLSTASPVKIFFIAPCPVEKIIISRLCTGGQVGGTVAKQK